MDIEKLRNITVYYNDDKFEHFTGFLNMTYDYIVISNDEKNSDSGTIIFKNKISKIKYEKFE